MSNIFQENNTAYDLRNKREFKTGNVRTVLSGTETISYRGPQIWDTLTNAIKHSTSLTEFKSKLNIGYRLNASAGMLYFYQGSWFYLTFITGLGRGRGNFGGWSFNINLC